MAVKPLGTPLTYDIIHPYQDPRFSTGLKLCEAIGVARAMEEKAATVIEETVGDLEGVMENAAYNTAEECLVQRDTIWLVQTHALVVERLAPLRRSRPPPLQRHLRARLADVVRRCDVGEVLVLERAVRADGGRRFREEVREGGSSRAPVGSERWRATMAPGEEGDGYVEHAGDKPLIGRKEGSRQGRREGDGVDARWEWDEDARLTRFPTPIQREILGRACHMWRLTAVFQDDFSDARIVFDFSQTFILQLTYNHRRVTIKRVESAVGGEKRAVAVDVSKAQPPDCVISRNYSAHDIVAQQADGRYEEQFKGKRRQLQ
ncbi:hypothetical protein GGX14DRAFT_406150 [Mycena pura]|uniref:Uncharacterized protein n=1 Tax=Mycena pura TaxID=153505 RepID=A0AAD6XYF2_9AGAR|nr:hypothetical protein GGX14DRAFT_406150 [Mycena pura]